MAYNVDSKYVKVYPSAYRGAFQVGNELRVVDPESRLTTENNLTRPFKALAGFSSGGFVLETSKEFDVAESSSKPLEFILEGYYFKIKREALLNLVSYPNVYASINIVTKGTNWDEDTNNILYEGESLAPYYESNEQIENQNTLDTNQHEFIGLNLYTDLNQIPSGKPYLLILQNGKVPVNSLLKFSSDSILGSKDRNDVEGILSLNKYLHTGKIRLSNEILSEENSFELKSKSDSQSDYGSTNGSELDIAKIVGRTPTTSDGSNYNTNLNIISEQLKINNDSVQFNLLNSQGVQLSSTKGGNISIIAKNDTLEDTAPTISLQSGNNTNNAKSRLILDKSSSLTGDNISLIAQKNQINVSAPKIIDVKSTEETGVIKLSTGDTSSPDSYKFILPAANTDLRTSTDYSTETYTPSGEESSYTYVATRRWVNAVLEGTKLRPITASNLTAKTALYVPYVEVSNSIQLKHDNSNVLKLENTSITNVENIRIPEGKYDLNITGNIINGDWTAYDSGYKIETCEVYADIHHGRAYNASQGLYISNNGISVVNNQISKVSSITALSQGNINVTSSKVDFSGDVEAESFNAVSDKRLKENIKEFKPSKSILDLPVVEFDYKSSKKHHIGCIAQDLKEICPEIVHENESGYLSIEESKIVYLLLDEMKKLKKEVNSLKSKLKSKVS